MATLETELLCPWARCLHCGAVRRARPLVAAECCDRPAVVSVAIVTAEGAEA